MSDVFDDIIDRQASPADMAPIAAIVASDFRFAYFGTAAFAVRIAAARSETCRRHPDEPAQVGEHPEKPELLRKFCDHLAKPGDETVVLLVDGRGDRDSGVLRHFRRTAHGTTEYCEGPQANSCGHWYCVLD